jgi:hypothetical protein
MMYIYICGAYMPSLSWGFNQVALGSTVIFPGLNPPGPSRAMPQVGYRRCGWQQGPEGVRTKWLGFGMVITTLRWKIKHWLAGKSPN